MFTVISYLVSFTHKDLPFIYPQLFILSKLIIPGILYTLPFTKAVFALSHSLGVTNICFMSFVTDDGNKTPSGVNL